MDEAQKLSEARSGVHQQLGRNLLFFQQIELLLKYLLRHAQWSGSLDEIQKMLVQWDRKTMGQLVEPLVDRLFTPFELSEGDLDPGKNSFSHSFSVEFTAEERTAFQQNLEALVKERNDLAHHALTRFPLRSVDDCIAAGEALRHQREKFVPFRDQIQAWARSLTDFHSTLHEQLEPDGAMDDELRKHLPAKHALRVTIRSAAENRPN